MPNSTEGQAKDGPNITAMPHRSTLASIGLIATCSGAMIVNVSDQPIHVGLSLSPQCQTASNTSVSIALPSIGKDLSIEENQLQWLVSAFALTSGCMLLVFGRLADLYGRKKAFMIGSLIQAAFSLGCGFAQSRHNHSCLSQVAHSFRGCSRNFDRHSKRFARVWCGSDHSSMCEYTKIHH